jgi:glycosyltransferase involved in cell wall biosynthesis
MNMKLVIQIPCKNEETTLPVVISELPKKIKGIDSIEIQVIDDGSTDRTSEVAKSCGADRVIRFNKNRGLWTAFKVWVEAALRAKADILINTDADNQYPGRYVKDLVVPILEGRADIVIGNRRPTEVGHFSPIKRVLQGLGNKILSFITGETLPDSVSGFRAYSRNSLYELNVTSKFSYVIDTIIQSYKKGLSIAWVPIETNLPTRPSRLFSGIGQHIRKSTVDILRVYTMYEPLKVFLIMSAPFLFVGSIGIFRFFFHYFYTGKSEGMIQSLVISGTVISVGISLFSLGIIADLIAKNRFLIEEQLKMMRRMKYWNVEEKESSKQ